jgi:hypothetical protein
MNNQAVIVVRSSGERTLEICVKLLKDQRKDIEIHIIEEQPFDAALLSCYKMGLSSGADWLITIDADTLLFDGSIDVLITEAEVMPENYFQLQGTILDNITGTIRSAGQRIYRTAYLEKAITFLESSPTRIRPEYAIIQQMVEYGYPSRSISKTLGIHDFDQYFRDLYRKAFVHANKHEDLLVELIRRCKSLMETNPDFRIILKGIVDGIGFQDTISIDTRLFDKRAKLALSELSLIEKSTNYNLLSDDTLNIFQKISQLSTIPTYQDHKALIIPSTFVEKLKFLLKEKGYVKGVFFIFGVLLSKIGNRLKNI